MLMGTCLQPDLVSDVHGGAVKRGRVAGGCEEGRRGGTRRDEEKEKRREEAQQPAGGRRGRWGRWRDNSCSDDVSLLRYSLCCWLLLPCCYLAANPRCTAPPRTINRRQPGTTTDSPGSGRTEVCGEGGCEQQRRMHSAGGG